MSNRTFKLLADSFVNFVSQIGVIGSKGASNSYQLEVLDQQQIDTAYRASWLARKVIDIPPLDMTREWRNWQAEDDQIQDLEDEEKRLGLVNKTKKALTWARLYGGAAIVLGVENGQANEPLDVEKVKKGQLKFIHIVSRHRLRGQEMDQDPMSAGYGVPKMFSVSSASTGNLLVHPSRLIRFIGNEPPDDELNGDGWGDPYWQSLKDIVGSTDLLTSVISLLVQEAKIDVITVPDLMTMMGTAEDEARLLKRMSLAMAVKSTNNTLLLDGGTDGKTGEKWDRKEMSFTGLADILRLYFAVASGAADIPATRLLGKSPDGMNATGDSDTRNYYDMLSSKQELEMWPQLEILDRLMQRSLWGREDEKVYFESAPLWQMTPEEKSTISKRKAETSQIYANLGVMPDEAISAAVQNQLLEDQVYPGLEAALVEFGTEPEEPPAPLALPAPGVVPPRLPAPGATPTPPTDSLHDARHSVDPTGTGTIRENWTGSIRTRLKMAEGRIRSIIRTHEAVGLDASHYAELLDKSLSGTWAKKYLVRSYRRGAEDAAKKMEIDFAPFDENDTAHIEALGIVINNDVAKLRTDIAAHIHSGVSTAVSVGAALNHVASSIKMAVRRGKLIAAVNSVAAHSKASLHRMKQNGVQFVGADIEAASLRTIDADELLQFATAGDNNVCPECEDLEGQIFTIDEAEGIIPVHPECRCAWIPIRDPGGRFNPRISTEEDSIGDSFIQNPETGRLEGSTGGEGGEPGGPGTGWKPGDPMTSEAANEIIKNQPFGSPGYAEAVEHLYGKPTGAEAARISTEGAITDEQQDALDRYESTENEYVDINAALRSGGTHEVVDAIDDVMARSTIDRKITALRGVKGDYADQLSKLSPGDEFQDLGYVSVSRDKGYAMEFAGDKGSALISISVPKGSNAYAFRPTSGKGDEGEIILPRGTKFRVISVKPSKTGRGIHQIRVQKI